MGIVVNLGQYKRANGIVSNMRNSNGPLAEVVDLKKRTVMPAATARRFTFPQTLEGEGLSREDLPALLQSAGLDAFLSWQKLESHDVILVKANDEWRFAIVITKRSNLLVEISDEEALHHVVYDQTKRRKLEAVLKEVDPDYLARPFGFGNF